MLFNCRLISLYLINTGIVVLTDLTSLKNLRDEFPSSTQADFWNNEQSLGHKLSQTIAVRDLESLRQDKEFLANPCFLQQIDLNIEFLAILTPLEYLNEAHY